MASRLSIRARFTLLYGMAITVTVILLCGGIYFFVERALMAQIENHLRKDLSTIVEYLKQDQAGLAKVADHGPILYFTVQDGRNHLISSENWINEKLGHSFSNPHSEKASFSVQGSNSRQYRVLIDSVVQGAHSYRITVAHDEG